MSRPARAPGTPSPAPSCAGACSPDGTPRALCCIEHFRLGRPDSKRNTFTRLFDGDWGVKLHAGISSAASVGDELDVAVTTRRGRVSHLRVRVVHVAETDARTSWPRP